MRGVYLLTYHRAKGLEFDAVFLPRLDEKELPTRLAKTDEARDEERRLFYVGITRARRHLCDHLVAAAEPVRRRARHRDSAGPAAEGAPSCPRSRCSTTRWRPGARSVPGRRRCRRTSSSTTRRSRRSRARSRVRSTSWRRPRCRPRKARPLRRRGARGRGGRVAHTAESSRSSRSCGSRRTRSPATPARFSSSSARGSVSGRRRPSRISSSSTPPSRPP